MVHDVKIPLDMDSGGGVQQNGLILFVEACELDHRPLDEGPRPRRDKVTCLLHGIILEGNNKETKLKRQPLILGNHFGR